MSVLIESLSPGVLVAAAAWALLPWLRPDDERARAAMVAVMIALMWRYMLWRWCETLPPLGEPLNLFVGLLFIVVETGMMCGITVSHVFLARMKDRTVDADSNARWLSQLEPAPLVDVFICTYNEEKAILERTIIGAKSMDYPRFRVWVLDDGRRAWLADMCQELGCRYITRDDNKHAKAGNINNALAVVSRLDERPDFIGILDADFVPVAQFLRRALTLFREPDVGIVQTPQHFINPDPLQSNLSAARVWPDEQRYFFDVVMAAKDAWGTSFCCGTSSVLRFDALERIGGFPTDSVTEDYLVTLKMKSEGFRTVYLNERLSLGLAPEGLKEYVTQRSRWALGFVQICRGPLGPLRPGNGLTPIDRICLIETFLYWSANYSFRLLGIVVPILYWLLAIEAVHANVIETLGYYLPYFVSQVVIVGWMTQGRVMPVMSDVTQLLAARQVLQAVAQGLLRPTGHKFRVTAKGGDRSRRFVQWPLLRVFLTLLALTLAGVVWAFLVEDGTRLRDASALCLFWSWYNIIVLALACVVCIEQPRLRSSERLSSTDLVTIESAGGTGAYRLLDISLGGARLSGAPPAQIGHRVTIELGTSRIPAVVVRCEEGSFGVAFDHSEGVRVALIRFVYSGRYSASVSRIEAGRLVAAVLGRVMR